MAPLASVQAFREWQERLARAFDPDRKTITICGGTGCTAFGAPALQEAFRLELEKRGLAGDVPIKMTGCHGFCEKGPVVVILPYRVFYPSVQPEDVPEIVEKTVLRGETVERLLYVDPLTGRRIAHDHEVPFYARQQRLVFRLNGSLDPTSLEDYVAHGGYAAAAKALAGMAPGEVIAEVAGAGLRGRGGAGFPTGRKWELARAASGEPKYLVCNADEGDPGAFMDRSLLEGTPHAILEGMLVAGYAIGASQGIVYVRAEYPLAVRNVKLAIDQARASGLLGKGILGTSFDFDVVVKEGAGAFVCGEETALLASLEGRRGMPRPRPPFPVQSGYLGKPTVINNVETLANVPLIIQKGRDWYRGLGTEGSKGTKIFALAGKVNNTGLVEVPMGATLRQIVYEIGGGIPGGRTFKAAQMGGPSGGCVPARYLDLPIDYESVKEVGAIMGSGGLIVLDETTCMVDIARYFMDFCARESCGKCPPCRIGTTRMLEILERIAAGRGRPEDLDRLEALALEVKKNALCGLGQTAPNPVLSTLRHFRDEYLEHIVLKRCRASACQGLVESPCAHACPAGVDVPDYLALAAEERFADALAVIQMRNPFASVCGRVCERPCELRCRRADLDEPLAIRDVKRHVTDAVAAPWRPPEACLERGGSHRVAVVGAGPAGLSCAYFLRLFGHRVTVFEALPEPGGMVLMGIPEYRLPAERLKRDVDFILSTGVELKLDSPVRRLEDLFAAGYEAVFVAVGAHRSTTLAGIDPNVPGVLDGIRFLRDRRFGRPPERLGRTVVIGGGNVAVDAARVARRLGGEVTVVYRRTRAEMPAYLEEIEGAEEEGIGFEFLSQPQGLATDAAGHVTALKCLRMRLGPADAGGRRRPVAVPGSEFEVPCDTVISAVGQTVAAEDDWKLELAGDGAYKVDPATLATNRGRVFAGGDCVRGPASAIQGIGDGQRAARSIDRLLGGTGELPDQIKLSRKCFVVEGQATPSRPKPGSLAPADRTAGFEEVLGTLGAAETAGEARRCLRCDLERELALKRQQSQEGGA